MSIRQFYTLVCDSPDCDTYAISHPGLGRVMTEAWAAGWEQERCTRGHITGLWHCALHKGQPRPHCPQAHGYPDEAAWKRRRRRRR